MNFACSSFGFHELKTREIVEQWHKLIDLLDDHEMLIAYKECFNRGFEVPMEFSHEGKGYQLRMIILFDHGLRAGKQNALQNRVQKTRDDFQELSGKLNRYKLKSCEQIDAAGAVILKKNNIG